MIMIYIGEGIFILCDGSLGRGKEKEQCGDWRVARSHIGMMTPRGGSNEGSKW